MVQSGGNDTWSSESGGIWVESEMAESIGIENF